MGNDATIDGPLTPEMPYAFCWAYNPMHTTSDDALQLGRAHLRGLVEQGLMPGAMLDGFKERHGEHAGGLRLVFFERMLGPVAAH